MGVMLVILRSAEFDAWLSALADAKGKARILARFALALRSGDFGTVNPPSKAFRKCACISAGYRVYFLAARRTVYLLLTGGDKSTQSKDIARAKLMARAIRENKR